MNLAGQYQLHPGSRPGITGARPVIGGDRLGHLLRGQPGHFVVNLLGNLLTLCAHAQRRTARLALWSAERQVRASAEPGATVLLQLETTRDHLRCMALDWPRRLEGSADSNSLRWLDACPLQLASPAHPPAPEVAAQHLERLQAWLEAHILQMPVSVWLHTYRDPAAFAAWCNAPAQRAKPLQCLLAWQTTAQQLQPSARTLDLLDTDATRQDKHLQAVARDLQQSPEFAQLPHWEGACAETGVWSRLRHRQDAATPHTALDRLQARWLELLELARAGGNGGAPLLQYGALPLGDGQAIAWCEMARGLLLHWVQLDGQQRVQDYRVLAPTEWNFHPDGALAQVVSQLERNDIGAANCLATAYDPCVEYRIHSQEYKHA